MCLLRVVRRWMGPFPWPTWPPSKTATRSRNPTQIWRLRSLTASYLSSSYRQPAKQNLLRSLSNNAICSQDVGSILSGVSKDSFEEDRGVTCTDIKLIMPTVLILLFTLFIMVTVIPYAFSSVIKQLQAVWALEEQCKSGGGIAAEHNTAIFSMSIYRLSCENVIRWVCHAGMLNRNLGRHFA